MPPYSQCHPCKAIRQPLTHVGRDWHTSETEEEEGGRGSKVPGSGSHEGFIMVKPVPATEVPKACTTVQSGRVRENSREVCTFEPQPPRPPHPRNEPPITRQRGRKT
ncbi:hypothetical protein Q8A73_003810 [Channa argus]|nr:hypothetical protein Q8A73_003810 [Channa argus]